MNKRDLLVAANEWVNRAKNDIRQTLVSFMDNVGADQNRIADALGLSVGEVEQILNGNGDVSLSTFAKLLIATDNVLEIKPLSAVAERQNGFVPLPDEFEEQIAPRGGVVGVPPLPQAPEHRPIVDPNNGMTVGEMVEIDLDRLTTEQLKALAKRDGFTDGEIVGRTRSEIIDMLEERQQEAIANGVFPAPDMVDDEPDYEYELGDEEDIFADVADENFGPYTTRDEHFCEPKPRRACRDRGCGCNSPMKDDSTFARMLINELENNPRLKEIIKRHLQ